MDEQGSAGGEGSTGRGRGFDPLRDWWLEALPALFVAAADRRETTGGAAASAPGKATTGRASQALKLTEQLYHSLCTAYFGALVKQPAHSPVAAFEDLLRGQLAQLAEHCDGMAKALVGPAETEAAITGLIDGMTKSMLKVLQPLSLNVERTYGGLADAFGLAPVRELGAAGRGLALASLAQRQALAEYLDVTREAVGQGIDALLARLAEMGERGESVDTLLALMRLCATTMDGAMHQAMQSPRALRTSAQAIRAGVQLRQERQRIVAIASEALNVPTRAEVDEAYREIQELKREVRRLRKSISERPPSESQASFMNGHSPNGHPPQLAFESNDGEPNRELQ